MPRHTFTFPPSVRNAVKRYVETAVRTVDPNRFRQEPAYCAALAQRLRGSAYDGPQGKVEFESTVVSDRGKYAAESWSGADLAITADISVGGSRIRKAILVQAKRGALSGLSPREAERLYGQIDKMRSFTRSPKIMDIVQLGGSGDPGIYSANIYRRNGRAARYSLANYIVQRVLTTLDGDTRTSFVEGVQDSDLTNLKIIAHRVDAVETAGISDE